MTVQLYRDPCADTQKKWFILATIIGVLIGAILSVALCNYEDRFTGRTRSSNSRTLSRTNHRRN